MIRNFLPRIQFSHKKDLDRAIITKKLKLREIEGMETMHVNDSESVE